MTEVNGLRLAYRGFVAGLAGAYVWLAIAMVLSALLQDDPLRPLRPMAATVVPWAVTPELAFVLGLATVQAGGGLVGLGFAYFFARFFTVRATLRTAAPMVAILAWSLASVLLARSSAAPTLGQQAVAVVACLGFGLVVGAGVPVRGEVTRVAAPSAPTASTSAS